MKFESHRQAVPFATRVFRALGAAALAVAALASGLAHAAPPAGTVIPNSAAATFNVGASGYTNNSNIVTAITSALGGAIYSATLSTDGNVVAAGGVTVNFPHVLTNTGAVADTYALAATSQGPGFPLVGIVLLPDTNGDGVADSATPIAPTTTLAPGGIFRFVVRATVPIGSSPASQGSLRVTATGAGNGVLAQNTDRVSIAGRPTVPGDCATATKALSLDRGPSPGGPITVSLTYDACDKARQKVLIQDTLPAGMTYVAGSARWTATGPLVLTDANATDAQGPGTSKITYDFGVTAANTVTAMINDLPATTKATVTFQVQIVPGLAVNALVDNVASYTFWDTAGNPGNRANTNIASYLVTGTADLTLVGQRLPTAVPGSTAVFTNVLTNKGNETDTFEITLGGSTFPAGTTFTLFKPDGVTPLTDTNGDGNPDTGPVAPNATYNIVVRALVLPTTVPGAYKITKSARSVRAPSRIASADDSIDTIVTKCALILEPDNQALTGFGTHVTYLHTLVNRGNCNESVTAQVSYLGDSRPGWRSQAFVDNASGTGGSIPGVLDSTDTQVTPSWTTTLAPGQQLRLLVDVLAPTKEEMQAARAAKSGNAKAIVDTNVTTLQLTGLGTGVVSVRDTTSVDDNKADGPDTENTIRNYNDSTFFTPTAWAIVGRNAYLRANAPACNAVADVVETRLVLITGLNGEREQVTATETGPNTGIFTVPALPVRLPPVTAGNGTLEGVPGTVFNMEVLGCSRPVSGVMTVLAPVSVVFDSRSNEPVAGASVQLLAASGSQCGAAIGTPVTSGSDGTFSITAAAGNFCLRVTPPNGYTFPSTVAYGSLPQGRNLVVSGATTGGSYGTPFTQAAGVVVVDVPVDQGKQDGLFVQKVASQALVELGEFVDYAVRVRNNTGNALDRANVVLVDDLPAGFAYVPGTVRRDGKTIADPVTNGPRLTLTIGNMERGQQALITYRVRVGPGALQGDGVNRVQATYVTPAATTVSNIATARVQVTGGVFSDRAFILGKVWMDCNANGSQDKGELGMPGVRLLIEDGTFVVTDGEGRYSFYGITNRTHVLKLDRSTLPPGAKLQVLSQRNLGDASSRIVDLKSGELHRGDFAIAGCDPAMVEEAAARAKAMYDENALGSLAGAQLATEARVLADPKTLPASGVVTMAAQQPGGTAVGGPALDAPAGASQGAAYGSVMTVPAAVRPTPAPQILPPAAEPVAMAPLETLVPNLDNKLGFVGLADGDTLPTAQATLRVKGTMGSNFKLVVNGAEISEKRIGKRATLAEKQVQAWEYVGIEMKPGVNELTVSMIDGFGNARGSETIRVRAPGKLGKIEIVLPAGGAVADGRTPAKVTVKVYDVDGVPVTTRTPVTIVASRGLWQIPDPDPNEPGTQVMVEGGVGVFPLSPPLEPGSSQIVASSGSLRAEARLDFLPELRSLVAAGVIEGIVNLRNIGSKSIVPTRNNDGFEQELKTLSRDFDGGKGQAAARAAFFLKGKIKGDMLLTAAYDSDKDSRERLFRDIQPDEFYPVYGDSAIRGFDAQSTSRLYVRVDKDRSYLLWGDYTTQSDSQVRKLSSYNRSLTGLRQHFENDRVSANVFASRDTSRQAIEELRANGTSGPYELGNRGALINSEKIEIVTRDRNQPAMILSALPLARFADYEIDALTGRILFKSPVSSVDRDLNPVFIRVTYEVDQGGPEFWVGGAEAQVKVTDRIEVGGVFVKDNNPEEPFKLGGINATVKLGENTYVMGEFARTEKGLEDKKGNGGRLEVKHESKDLKAQAFVARTDKDFDNPGAYLTQGRGEAGGRLEYKVRDGTLVRAEALRTEDLTTNSVRDGAMVAVTQEIGEKLSLEVGVRHAAERGTASPVPYVPGLPPPQPLPDEVTTVRARLTGQVPFVPNATVYGEAEVDVQDTDRKILAAGAEYQLPNKGRLYARHEFISSITGPYGLNAGERQNTTAVGVDMDYMKDGRLFSEYRIRDALAGGDAEAAFGLKNLWTLAPGLRLGTSFERVHALSGTGQNENTALALGLEYTANAIWKASTRLELRDASTQQSLLSTVGFAAKINRDWTALVRNAYSLTRNKDDDGERTIERMQAGVSYRDSETNMWNALARVEHRLEDDDTLPGISLKKTTEIVSVNADWQPIRPFVVSGRYAAKWTSDKTNGLSTKYRAQVIGGRATWEFAPKWDVGIVASALFGDSTASRQYGVGVEVGYQAFTNFWVSAGYNFMGYKDADLSGADYTAKGPFVRVRYKFDEQVLEAFAGDKNEKK
ncbi:hypothetical protein DSM104443_01804 [Usitatibacter rugosus]|uniref:Repeat protein (TIGR01451 family) n=1 Tax=Usitatibacter rugosus TaxID=2732067 RepID=A0A6M4GUP8_9PROT|nr:SdrD B-like domain-containing protein [Usitatibacter rugosus]QJR10735.1 hypothetical protein DSM104443_01804 [Usitatibacter rugosus]